MSATFVVTPTEFSDLQRIAAEHAGDEAAYAATVIARFPELASRVGNGETKIVVDASLDRALTPSELAAYLSSRYGTCALPACSCLASYRYPSTECPHWTPTRARTWEELAIEMAALEASRCA